MPPEPSTRNRTVKTATEAVLFLSLTFSTAACLTFYGAKAETLRGTSVAAVAEPPPLPLPTEINGNFLTQVEACLLPVAAAYGYELRITSGYRTKDGQDRVFQQGRTENGHIVTEVAGGQSLHNFGLAVDVVDRWRGYAIDWDRLGHIGAYCGLEQNDEGDQAHFTHRDGLTISQLTVGFRPDPLSLPCPLLAERAGGGQKLTQSDLQECGIPKF